MVLLTATPQILTLISTLPASTLSTVPSKDLPSTPGSPVSQFTILTLARLARSSADTSNVSLNSLLRGAHPYRPPPAPKPTKSPEYVALMARLRAEQEQREYRTLISNRITDETADQDTGEKDDISPSLVFNILISIVMCAVAVFVMTRYWQNDGLRVLVSLGTGLVVGCAEVGMYAIYLRKVRESQQKERRMREKKFILESEEIGGRKDTEKQEDILRTIEEKDEIWGRGKHGGARRRVREEWEKGQEQDKAVS